MHGEGIWVKVLRRHMSGKSVPYVGHGHMNWIDFQSDVNRLCCLQDSQTTDKPHFLPPRWASFTLVLTILITQKWWLIFENLSSFLSFYSGVWRLSVGRALLQHSLGFESVCLIYTTHFWAELQANVQKTINPTSIVWQAFLGLKFSFFLSHLIPSCHQKLKTP